MDYKYWYQEKLLKDREEWVSKKMTEQIEESGLLESFEEVEESEVSILSRFIVIIAIIGDIFGLIPIVGNFFGLFFAVILMILYFINGLGKGFFGRGMRKAVRRWLLRLFLYSIEIFIPGISWIPLFTAEALIDYNLSKRGYYKKIEKAEEIINKIK